MIHMERNKSCGHVGLCGCCVRVRAKAGMISKTNLKNKLKKESIMAEVLTEKFVDQFGGRLDEKGGWFGGGNGVAEAGETFKYKRSKTVLTDSDVSSYEGFARLLERVTSAQVDVLRNDRGNLKYFVYRHAQDGIRVVDPNRQENLYSRHPIEEPNFEAFADYHIAKIMDYTTYYDFDGLIEFRMAYIAFDESAQVYSREVRDYQQDLNDFNNADRLNGGDVEVFLDRTGKYNEVAAAYYAAKSKFYSLHPVDYRAPIDPSDPYPVPPSRPRPIPPQNPRPIPDEDGNNPDEVDDI